MNKTHSNSQNGQSLIIIALMIVGILGFLGLVLDGGQVFLTRRNSQDAADAGAFAGVRALATRPDNSITSEQAIYSAARDYARVNHVITDTDVTVAYIDQTGTPIRTIDPSSPGTVPNNPLATGVMVTATIRLQPYFIDLLIGNNLIPVPSVAAAQSGVPSIGSLVAPVAIRFPCPYPPANPSDPKCNFQYAPTVYRLFGDATLSGGFQWTDFKQTNPVTGNKCTLEDYVNLICSSGPILADKLDTYYDPITPSNFNTPPPYPNPWVSSDTGVQNDANLSAALNCWLDPTITGCWPQPGPKPTDRLWIVPVFDHDNGTGQGGKYHTVMFAEFEFRGYWFSNQHCNWIGKPPTRPNENPCDNKPLGSLTADLQPCADYVVDPLNPKNKGIKCLMGYFKKEVVSLQIKPGACNTNGLDVCAIGLSQ